jgi:hypothetical protein
MLAFTRATKMAAAAVSLAVMLLGAATPSQAQTTGTVRLHIVKVGFIIGVGGGSGVLFYHGHRYRLSVSGVGLGSLGIAAVDLVGTASNLTSPGAIAGTYAGAGAGGSFVGGGQVATLQNGNGVVLQLQGVQAGFQVSLGLGGMTLMMRYAADPAARRSRLPASSRAPSVQATIDKLQARKA